MSETLLATLITAAFSLAGVVITCVVSSRKTTNEVTHKLELHQAVTDTKIEALREEVSKHNNVIERTFRLEGRMNEAEHDIRDLKGYHKPKPVE